ncbi:transposase [Elysia marginata]|uniref:Transposase n=1 Tax=Elysia marginata TaxID=1093978 RepID=A0AAV4F8G8_9GAST|nr:transposase [Elysia marginata]
MVSAGVYWNGKTEIVFIDMKTAKVNLKNYISLLRKKLLPSRHKFYPQGDFILQQDDATLHTSRGTQQFLIDQGVDIIAKDHWPPQFPDFNPMDYAMWESLA